MQFRAISQNWASGAQRPPFSALVVALIAGVVLLAPIGHKNDTLIMGSGGYRFGDSWRMAGRARCRSSRWRSR